ncbi:Rv3654c family TadE-like protein [Corynebacterium sputi]|uniref:Rv3654c family TadE-like protein n=1 Tax=Corynebacterium sputi TaxID=489915 RepID=UPI00040BE061|nr:Rv3654c family TadE-like protein [Corynebacterium sputi]
MRITGIGRVLRSEQGSTTVTSAMLVAALCAMTITVSTAGAALVDRKRAQSAADSAALAGAIVLQDTGGGSGACEIARDLAADNGAELQQCTRDQEDITVTVIVRGKEGTSRAGPID